MAHQPSNLLLLSGGSKVAIARIAQAATRKRGIELHISDTSPQVPCSLVADRFHTLPKHTDPNWEAELAQLCETYHIGLVIPTRHSELLALSKAQPALSKRGTQVSISSSATLEICTSKIDTSHFLKQEGFPTPITAPSHTVPEDFPFPAIAKPNDGSASHGIIEIRAAKDLGSVPENWVLQAKAVGQELTVNVYIDKNGKALCAIPHERLVVDSGEVSQARTRRHPALIRLCQDIAERLPGARGIINIQAFFDPATQQCNVIEINPRIGGGYPLCDAAKGHYLEWLCQEFLDKTEIKPFESWTENLLMMRYREAIFSL